MASQREHFAHFCIPDLRNVTSACGENLLAIGREAHRTDPVIVPFEREQFYATLRVPNFGSGIAASRHDSLTVRGKRNRSHARAVPRKRSKFLSAGPIPDLGG